MVIPKSSKLAQLEAEAHDGTRLILSNISLDNEIESVIRIREIPCLNDFVAILVSKRASDIALPEAQKFKNEGIVVGIGPGLPDNNGSRVKTQLQLGDVVLFSERSIAMEIDSDKPPYKNKRVIIIQEKSLICKLPPVEFQLES